MISFEPSLHPSSLIAFVVLALLIARFQLRKTRVHCYKPLPGPPVKPIIGNILDVFPRANHEKLTADKALYGDVVFYHGLGNRILVLNSYATVDALLSKRAEIYSNRPHMTFAADLLGLRNTILFLGAGPELREQRRLMHMILNAEAAKRYHSQQEALSALLAKRFLESPATFFEEIRLTSSALVISLTYGISVTDANDDYIKLAGSMMHIISSSLVPGAYFCDIIPALKHLPAWVPFQRKAAEGRKMIEDWVTTPFEHVKQQMANGTATPSLTERLLSRAAYPTSKETFDEERIKWTMGALYGGAYRGGETVFATVLVFLIAIALNPDKQELAQKEIDRVLGIDVLPTIQDRARLPYVDAIVKETMRWHPVFPRGVARATAQDDRYNDWFIPKGTVVIPNFWALSRENVGENPEAFIPERFLSANPPRDPSLYVFGFGRRICPGKHVAENAVFILVATILSCFDVRPPPGGKLDIAYDEMTLISYPLPYDVSITPRTASKASLIKTQCDNKGID